MAIDITIAKESLAVSFDGSDNFKKFILKAIAQLGKTKEYQSS